MYKKTMMKLSVLLLATTTVLTACGGNNNNAGSKATNTPASETPSNTPQENKKEVSFTIGYASGDPATKKAISDTVKKFTAANPNVTIKDLSETSSAAYLDWLKTKDAVGEFPDLVEMRDTEVFADAGKIVELPSDLLDLFEAPPQVDGKVWNAPLQVNAPQGIIYSKKAYADAGITELPKTYDEFIAIQEKLKTSGITPIVVGGKDIFHMGFWVNKFLIDEVYSKDADWNSKRTAKTVSFTDANVVQGITDFKELFKNYVDKGWLSTGDNQTASILVSGKAAQLYSGTWMFTQIAEADPNFEFGFYALPDREGKINVIGLPSPAGWSLSAEAAKDADKTEAIKDFIRFFFAPEQYSNYLATINAIPSTKEKVTYDTSEQMQVALDLIADPNVVKSLAINNWWGDNLIPPQFRNWYYKLLQDLVVKDGDVAKYMKDADTEYDNQVKANQM
ncbi:extracellular solute-binding protein [Paenibacillus sp. FSL R7-0048]|jgi:raffinose/stachyose/melibiose transport system substrate-binding protein|uniref:ABC transporter substrate-binding protein n=1 Tax=Paenibacillus TaxID=44249 RepID=UPI00096F7588|nr:MULTISPECIES: extracellular solute-binding protein [Paenibacillus]MDH6428259.1 raffinose/stachyose/melibiose transport system substrate-binding protein [Paenibacillus sp. PastH-4]MDH6444109.1 raffinose/stachyose/melibiose transport system substrate-binding protein [Paenibacillus sp. PastF-4]MDH6528012.1 raffinose/stachyose/melibiose transport system substrate-binding protein [Paenibacillus sp. PastH-3]OMC69698.1 ABC transporter substrate-binding protein [Paenibacillus odorifer]OMC78802.1 AB